MNIQSENNAIEMQPIPIYTSTSYATNVQLLSTYTQSLYTQRSNTQSGNTTNKTVVRLDDYDVDINDKEKSFTIYHRAEKQEFYVEKTIGDVLSTLRKIHWVLLVNFKNVGQDKPYSSLLMITKDLSLYYRKNALSIFNTVIDPTLIEVNRLAIQIEKLVEKYNFPSKAFPNLNDDTIQFMLNHFTLTSLQNFAKVNREAKKFTEMHLIKRAMEWGNTDNLGVDQSWQFLKEVKRSVKDFCDAGNMEKCHIPYENDLVDSEKVLNRIANFSSENFFRLFAQNEIYDPSNKKIRDYIFAQEKLRIKPKNLGEEFSAEIRQIGVNAICKAYSTQNDLSSTEFLLNRSAHANSNTSPFKSKPDLKLNLLDLAALNGDIGILKLLIEKGANLNLTCSNGSIAFHFAAQMGHLEIVKLLFNKDVINKKGCSGQTALHFACEYNKKDVVEFLIQNGADLNSINDNGKKPFHHAALHNSPDCFESLLNRGEDIDSRASKKSWGRTCLHIAMRSGYHDFSKVLLQKGANVNLLDDEGNSPLHLAVYGGDANCIRLLLNNGAEDELINNEGLTPLKIACKLKRLDLIEILCPPF